MYRKPKQLENGNGQLVGYVVRNTETGLVADDGFGHFKVYGNIKAARRKASQLNCAPVPKIHSWKAFAVNTIISRRPAREYQN
jgi:hypothetical protein